VDTLIILVSVVHLSICVALIVFVLLHSGRGTGLSSMLGGVMSQAGASTGIIERNLDRITVGLAVAFTCTSLLLAFVYKPAATNTAATSTVPGQSIPATPSK
jgi:preprotein translocase subunit SecG